MQSSSQMNPATDLLELDEPRNRHTATFAHIILLTGNLKRYPMPELRRFEGFKSAWKSALLRISMV